MVKRRSTIELNGGRPVRNKGLSIEDIIFVAAMLIFIFALLK